ncbi:MAG: hypothetical protein ACTHXA_13490 [Gulosibacter sp.]|uniref:hypothetical protein n=1 Tax=Gulosibacter sp. TaxID=2817531 RepID=UPI003F93D5C4
MTATKELPIQDTSSQPEREAQAPRQGLAARCRALISRTKHEEKGAETAEYAIVIMAMMMLKKRI